MLLSLDSPLNGYQLMQGLDEIGLTLARDTAISKFEAAANEHRPWLRQERRYAGVAIEGDRRT